MPVRRSIVPLLWRLHRWMYARTGGQLGGRIVGMPVLLLRTRGRRTGRPHCVALTYLPDGSRYIVIASNGGAGRHPHWYGNLRAHGFAEIQVGSHTISVSARAAGGAERARLWQRAVQAYPGYARYQRRTRRVIPVAILAPR